MTCICSVLLLLCSGYCCVLTIVVYRLLLCTDLLCTDYCCVQAIVVYWLLLCTGYSTVVYRLLLCTGYCLLCTGYCLLCTGYCCLQVGSDGAGHFVKMVHNGIEYGDMQLICESYHLMKDVLGMGQDEMAQVKSKNQNFNLTFITTHNCTQALQISLCLTTSLRGCVRQWVEHLTSNLSVMSLNPIKGSHCIPCTRSFTLIAY
mgnify:CR=1 FL=1